jgi:hypothetical protein
VPTTRSRRDLLRGRWIIPRPGPTWVCPVGQLLNLAGLVIHRQVLQFVGISTFLVAAVIGVTSFARSIENGWPYPDETSPASKLRAARAAEGIVPGPLTVVYRRWVVDLLRGLIGRRRFARRERIKTWIVTFVLVAFWATSESFGDIGVGGLHGFLTKLAGGSAILFDPQRLAQHDELQVVAARPALGADSPAGRQTAPCTGLSVVRRGCWSITTRTAICVRRGLTPRPRFSPDSNP